MPRNVVLITGAAGWLGGLLANALLQDLRTSNLHLILADIVEPKPPPSDSRGNTSGGVICIPADLTNPLEAQKLFQTEYGVPDTVYSLHGVMSRGSEDNFDLGIKINVDSVRHLLDATRQHSSKDSLIKFIFTSSLAVYGGPLPDIVKPDTLATPEGAYGMGKLASELFIKEYTRRGFIDGRILRLPTIVVRPGVPSAATSAFLSGIIREPLKNLPSLCPIGDSLSSPELTKLNVWVASPPTTIRNLIIAKHIPSSAFTPHTRVVCLPGFTTSVREMLDALETVAGRTALDLVQFKDDEANRRIVGSWPARFDNGYASSLGFVADEGGMVPIVQRFKEDVEAGLA